MNKTETMKILVILKKAYPNMKDPDNPTVELWQQMFDEPYELVSTAVHGWITSDTKGFPPVIGQIKEKVRLLTQPKELTEEEVWKKVKIALSNMYQSDPKRNKRVYETLPESIKPLLSVSEMLDWVYMDSSQLNTVVKSNFLRSYRERARQIKEYDALPESAKEMSTRLQEKAFKELT